MKDITEERRFMMIEKLSILLILIGTIFLCIGFVCATEVTMKVDSKHIIGMGTGSIPLDVDDFVNPMYVISERQMDGTADKYIVQEYPVTIQDYVKIQIGQTVTLEVPESRTQTCKVIEVK